MSERNRSPLPSTKTWHRKRYHTSFQDEDAIIGAGLAPIFLRLETENLLSESQSPQRFLIRCEERLHWVETIIECRRVYSMIEV
jgi:hypothetical protein